MNARKRRYAAATPRIIAQSVTCTHRSTQLMHNDSWAHSYTCLGVDSGATAQQQHHIAIAPIARRHVQWRPIVLRHITAVEITELSDPATARTRTSGTPSPSHLLPRRARSRGSQEDSYGHRPQPNAGASMHPTPRAHHAPLRRDTSHARLHLVLGTRRGTRSEEKLDGTLPTLLHRAIQRCLLLLCIAPREQCAQFAC